MTDMAPTIVPKSDQLNADSLLAGPRTITIRDVKIAPGTEQPVAIFSDGDDGKPYLPCKSMRRVMVTIWGADASAYIGRGMTLYRDPDVTWGGMNVGGIRISNMSHMDARTTIVLTATKKTRAPFTVHPLVVQERPKETSAVAPREYLDATGEIKPVATSAEKARADAHIMIAMIADMATLDALHDFVGDSKTSSDRDAIRLALPRADEAIARSIAAKFNSLGAGTGETVA